MSAAFTPSRYKLSIDDYHKLGDAGILDEDSRVELIEGDLIEMAPIGVAHMRCVNRLNRLLMHAVGDAAIVSVQNPVSLPPRSEPQPDVALFKPGTDSAEHIPQPADVLLIVEVADTTLDHDRRTRLPLYARAGIVEAWIVDVQGQTIEAFSTPGDAGYAGSTVYRRGESVAPAQLPTASIRVDDVFG
jgi:Uma2 family endonuclease